MGRGRAKAVISAAAVATIALAAFGASHAAQPPEHSAPWPGLGSGANQQEIGESLKLGPELHRNVSAADMLRERRVLDAALRKLAPAKKGVVEAFVVAIALDSDPVFAREAREAGKVLGRRYNAANRTLVLAGPDGRSDGLPKGSISALFVSLAHIAEVMNEGEDVLVLYSTSHGVPQGLTYHYGDTGYGLLSPERFKSELEALKIRRRILMLSACYSGIFVEPLASPDTAILTASYESRTSFGCAAENDWTFFGDALINRALRQPVSLGEASAAAHRDIASWEAKSRLPASLPQTRIGEGVASWLAALEARMPQTATEPVGRPAVGE